jgi:hypothetical protein
MNGITWIEVAPLAAISAALVFWLARGFVRELNLMSGVDKCAGPCR